jgi:hypothetical protein
LLGEIISFVGDRCASTLARAFAVESAESLELMMADLGDPERASWEWGQRRAANRLEPAVPVELVPQDELLAKAANLDLLLIDAPACSRQAALWLAQHALLTVVAMENGGDSLEDMIGLLAALGEDGSAGKVIVALCDTDAEDQTELIRSRLGHAGCHVLAGEIPFSNSFRDLQRGGRAVSECPRASLAREAQAVISAIQGEVASRLP